MNIVSYRCAEYVAYMGLSILNYTNHCVWAKLALISQFQRPMKDVALNAEHRDRHPYIQFDSKRLLLKFITSAFKDVTLKNQ